MGRIAEQIEKIITKTVGNSINNKGYVGATNMDLALAI